MSDADLTGAFDKAGLSEEASEAILDVNQQARLGGALGDAAHRTRRMRCSHVRQSRSGLRVQQAGVARP
jgi:hypothetical protein